LARLETRLTERFGLDTPIVSAPMALAGSGALAAAVSEAGGLGLIGGGYGDEGFLRVAFEEAGNTPVGAGFITWSLARQTHLLDLVLERAPKALMLSFGDPRPFASAIHLSETPLICQCQTIAHVEDAIDAGAAVVVAQGGEAGGHGAARGTMSFVAETADHLATRSPDTLLLAAGGIADGRGLAAALMLGADGVLMGSRFWASAEASVAPALQDAAIAAGGDHTIKTSIPDIARDKDWPAEFQIRVLENAMTREWHPRQDEARADPTLKAALSERYARGAEAGDPDDAGIIVGEAAGLIHDRPSARVLVDRITTEAKDRLARGSSLI
jgi:nitronate monooxygenase